jgi:GT2 family glycosyltransferase
MNTQPLVTCFILNWNRKEETCRAIDSVINQSYTKIEILLVDNGSDDGSLAYIQSKYPQIHCVQLEKNFGCPGGRNRGIKYCKGKYVFHVDNDGVLHEKAVEKAIEIIHSDTEIAVLTGLIIDFADDSEIDVNIALDNKNHYQTNLFQGGISIHRKSIYSEVGFYPDDYMYGGEETYLSYRILDAGYKIVKSNQVVLWHKKSDLARDNEKESLRKWSNALVNAYQIFPIENFIIYYVYFYTVYPVYAFKQNFLRSYIKMLPEINRRFKKYNRKPIKREMYYKFKELSK